MMNVDRIIKNLKKSAESVLTKNEENKEDNEENLK